MLSAHGLLHASFNQDGSCIIVAGAEGISIYSVDAHKVVNTYRTAGAVALAEMLFNTCLVGYVGAGQII